MKKIIDFLKSIILPRKMVKFIKINFFISLLVFFVAGLLNVTTANNRVYDTAEKNLAFYDKLDKLPDNTKLDNFPKVSINDADNIKVTVTPSNDAEAFEIDFKGKYLKADQNGVYHQVFDVEGEKLDITFVVSDKTVSLFGSEEKPQYPDFDLEGYIKQTREENTTYLFYLLTMDQLFYLYNLEIGPDGNNLKAAYATSVYEVENKAYRYYLPKDESELKINDFGDLDTRLWTRVAGKDDKIDFEITNDQFTSFKNKITPATRHQNNILYALFGSQFLYNDLHDNGLDFSNLNTDLKSFLLDSKAALIKSDGNQMKFLNIITSLILTIIFPLVFSLISWIFSKSFKMRKFKNYYAVAAICFFNASLIGLVLGLFLDYGTFSFPLLIFATLYYILATFRINTTREDGDTKGPQTPNSPEKKTVEYKEVKSDVTLVG